MYVILFERGIPTNYVIDDKFATAIKEIVYLGQTNGPGVTACVAEPKPVAKRKKPKFTTKRKCGICGKAFVIKGPTQRFCSPSCVRAAEKIHEKAKG